VCTPNKELLGLLMEQEGVDPLFYFISSDAADVAEKPMSAPREPTMRRLGGGIVFSALV